MGIVEQELANFDLGGENFRVELNEGPIIHIHMGRMRLDLTPDEFRHFEEIVHEGKLTLDDVKEFNRSE